MMTLTDFAALSGQFSARMTRAALAGLALLCAAMPLPAQAQEQAQGPADEVSTLVFLGADPGEGLTGPAAPSLRLLSFPALPSEQTVATDVLSAVLRASPVSTYLTAADGVEALRGDVHLVVDLALGGDAAAPTVTVGDQTIALAALSNRLAALATALGAQDRQTAYIRIEDPGDLLPAVLPILRQAIGDLGFAVTAVIVGSGSSACEGPRTALHYEVLAGVPDRAPFGSGDGAVSVAETLSYLQGALARDRSRGAVCAARYSLILASADLAATLVTLEATPLFPDLEQAVFLESFQALFLMSSEDDTAIEAFLANCQFCPSETDLNLRLRSLGEAGRARALEASVWAAIAEDIVPDRIAIYLAHCQQCAYRAEAEARLAELTAQAEAREGEALALAPLLTAGDLAGLRDWRMSCVACISAEAVDAKIAELEADGRFANEADTLTVALEARNPALFSAWLDTCELCGQRETAEAALSSIVAEAEAAAPCVAAAGLPQQGGPRLLSDIDASAATAACAAVLAAAPGNALARTLQGRIALAAGDGEAAAAAYAVGMNAGLREAFGLAAHALYAPVDDAEPDYQLAETYALQGYAAGDWLSGEVLTVLYSRELIPGKDASDAFEVALAQAQAGNPVAQFFAGFFLRTGTGVAPSDPEAARWLEAALGQGYMHAGAYLAEILETGGDGVAADPARAAQIYLTGLDAGDPTVLDRLTNQIEDRPGPVVELLQAQLREAGVFRSRVDGIPGPATARAVDAYYDQRPDAG